MQEPRTLLQEEDPRPKPYKKKVSGQSAPSSSKKGDAEKAKVGFAGSAKPNKTLKSNLKADASLHADGFGSDSLPEYSSYSGDYRGLRHKYLFLEEESISLDRELNMVESEIKALENEKFGLLDQLVVLEGLVDPSELKSKDAF